MGSISIQLSFLLIIHSCYSSPQLPYQMYIQVIRRGYLHLLGEEQSNTLNEYYINKIQMCFSMRQAGTWMENTLFATLTFLPYPLTKLYHKTCSFCELHKQAHRQLSWCLPNNYCLRYCSFYFLHWRKRGRCDQWNCLHLSSFPEENLDYDVSWQLCHK